MASVVFNPTNFRAAFPAYSALTDAQLNAYFGMSVLILDNTDASLVSDLTERSTLLNWLVAHYAELVNRGGAVTGSLSSASQGSVSASYSPLSVGMGAAWFMQTQWGAMYWQATAKYRLGGRYYVCSKC